MGPLLPTHDLPARVADVVSTIRSRSILAPRVGLTLGSGLGGVMDAIQQPVIYATRDLPHWPRSTVAGHAGRFALGHLGGVPVAALAGRSHRYEGYWLDQVTLAARVMHALGARVMLFTNAVGAVNRSFRPGELMVATDHVNWIGRVGLFTPAELIERRAGRRTASYYSPRLREALLRAAAKAGVPLHQGVLMGGKGPTYETAAEIRMAAKIGADVACMSTVHEVTVAAELGCEAASLSCITNLATGISETRLTHEDVTVVADQGAVGLRKILEQFLRDEAAAAR
jgi:purine-nucleoside phosphorylase